MLYVDITQSTVNINKSHVDITELHVDTTKLHVDITCLAGGGGGQWYATTQPNTRGVRWK